jgi:hypothetical protein
MTLEARLGGDGLALSTGRNVYLYTEKGLTAEWELPGTVHGLGIAHNKLLAVGNFDGIREVVSNTLIAGAGKKWKTVAHGRVRDTMFYRAEPDTLFASLLTPPPDNRGVFVFNMQGEEQEHYHVRALHWASRIPLLTNYRSWLIVAPSVYPDYMEKGSSHSEWYAQQVPGFFLYNAITGNEIERDYVGGWKTESGMITHRITALNASPRKLVVARYDGVWASQPQVRVDDGYLKPRFTRLAQSDAPVSRWVDTYGALLFALRCRERVGAQLRAHIDQSPLLFDINERGWPQDQLEFHKLFVPAVACEAIHAVASVNNHVWYGDNRGVVNTVSLLGGSPKFYTQFDEPVRAMVTLPKRYLSGGFRNALRAAHTPSVITAVARAA